MKTTLSTFVKCVTLTTFACLYPALSEENEHFFKHLLKNLKNDILNLKPGSNKTYVINHKLLGRNDSIELDIKSRTKGSHKADVHEVKRGECKMDTYIEEQRGDKFKSGQNRKNGELLRHNLRKAMRKEIDDIRGNHNLRIKEMMRHKELNEGRKKIRIKVFRKHKTSALTTAVSETVHDKVDAETKAKNKVQSIKILHLPSLGKLRKCRHRVRKVVNCKDVFDQSEYYDSAASCFQEGGQIPQLFLGNEYNEEQISEMFRNTKDLEVIVRSSTTSTTTTTTTTAPTTKNVKDEYTYEYVYEDELEKDKDLKKPKFKDGKKKGGTDDGYTYEYVYEDEIKKTKDLTSVTTAKPTEATTVCTTTENIPEEEEEEVEYTEEQDSNVKEPAKLSPSIEKEIQELKDMESNVTVTTVGTEEYHGDSNSQYKQPPRFMYDSEHQPQDDSQYSMNYDWNCPAKTTKDRSFRIAASSIMYDDEDTDEFLAERNRTKMERGYDSYPADIIFTADRRKFVTRYTRPSATPKDYESIDEYIDHWGGDWVDHLQGDPRWKHRRNKTSMEPIGRTKAYNATRWRQKHNVTFNERMDFNFDLDELLKNFTNVWMRNFTHPRTQATQVFVTMDDWNKYRVPEYLPQRKIRRMKRDIGGGMKMPRMEWEALMYLAQKVNHTRWIARLRKMKAAKNLMELLIHRNKKKVNKKGIVYKQKAIKPKKRPKGPKRIIQNRRGPRPNKKAVRIKLGAQRRRKKEQRKRRSVDNEDWMEVDHNGANYIDIKAFDEVIIPERNKRDIENQMNIERKKRNVKNQAALNDFISDMERNPERMQGTIENMTQVYQANLLETHKMSIDKAMDETIQNQGYMESGTQLEKDQEILVYRTFICEYKKMMEDWFLTMFYDVPNAMRRYAKEKIFKLRPDRKPSTTQLNKYLEYDNYLCIRLEMTEKVIRTTMKHFYDEMEDKVFGYYYGFDRANKMFKDPFEGRNRTTLSDQDLLRLLVKTTTVKGSRRAQMAEAKAHMEKYTDKHGNTQPIPVWR